MNRLRPREQRIENKTERADRALSEWAQYERECPELQLSHIQGDALTWLFAGEPDPVVSLAYWEVVCTKLSQGDAMDAVQRLLELIDRYPFTGMHSGWIRTVLGRIVLEDERAAQKFMKSYWAKARRALPRSTMAAYAALNLVKGEHRTHWLRAVNWMLNFHRRTHRRRESHTQFAERALNEYRNRPDPVQHTCLQDDGIKAIAIAVVDNPNLRSTELCDQALVELCPDTSRSTLSHLRGMINKRYGRPPR